MPSFIVFDEITDVGPEQIAALAASPMCRVIPGRQTDDTRSPLSGLRDCVLRFAAGVWREPELQGTLITRAHLPMQTLSPFLLGSQERATGRPDPAPQPEPAAAPMTAKELAEARENARPQVTKDVKPPDTVRK